jgi:phosphatidylinositol-binding clathrin assembly protein
MSKPDAERALAIYKTFAIQTDQVVAFLGVARQYANATRLEIPKLKHAPTGLAGSLEEYLNDPDFEINRRQYLAQKEAKKGAKTTNTDPVSDFGKLSLNGSTSKSNQPLQNTQPAKTEAKGPAPDLIDLFASIEDNQQQMLSQPQQQLSNAQAIPQYQFRQQQQPFPGVPAQMNQSGAAFDSTNPFASMVAQPQQNFSGINGQAQTQNHSPFNVNQLSPIPQNQVAPFQQQQLPNIQQPFGNNQQPSPQFPIANSLQPTVTGTNPFRASMMPQTTATNVQPLFPNTSPMLPQSTQQSTNPFRASTMPATNGQTPFNSAPPSSTASFFSAQSPQSTQSFQSMPPAQPLQPARTGTNPFKSAPTSTHQTPITSPLMPHHTGTNPFRQSAFVNQQTGQGWQSNQGTMGGLEQLNTIPVFPRPATQGQSQTQQPWPS